MREWRFSALSTAVQFPFIQNWYIAVANAIWKVNKINHITEETTLAYGKRGIQEILQGKYYSQDTD